MSRTGEDHNITRNAEFDAKGQADAAYAAGQGDIGQYRQNIGTLERGGQVGVDPYRTAGYLSNVNKLQSNSLNSATNAGKTVLADTNRRGGGENTSATTGAQTGLALQRGRLASNLSAGRATEDFGRNLEWQRYLAGAPLSAASAEGGLYGTGAGLTGSLNADLTKYGTAQQQEQYALLAKAIQAGETAASAGVGAATGGAGFGGFGGG